MFSRSADPLPLERRNDVVSFVSGVACWEEGSKPPAQQLEADLFNHQGFSRNGILNRRCARNSVFRSRLAHLMQVSKVRPMAPR